ncbi:MAG: hypothetical protein IK089_02060 [Oxalobacter sp.]|nr:hypothetical protein [Oxalobacter sp.]MBR6000021.1 hypothetical protein [Oxalobacter sp.]
MKYPLLTTILIGSMAVCHMAQAQETDKWRLLVEDDETAIYAEAPTTPEKMKADGFSIRIHRKDTDASIADILVKAGCEDEELYLIAGQDLDPDAPIKDTWIIPPMKKFTLDAPKGSLYGRLRELICGG